MYRNCHKGKNQLPTNRLCNQNQDKYKYDRIDQDSASCNRDTTLQSIHVNQNVLCSVQQFLLHERDNRTQSLEGFGAIISPP